VTARKGPCRDGLLVGRRPAQHLLETRPPGRQPARYGYQQRKGQMAADLRIHGLKASLGTAFEINSAQAEVVSRIRTCAHGSGDRDRSCSHMRGDLRKLFATCLLEASSIAALLRAAGTGSVPGRTLCWSDGQKVCSDLSCTLRILSSCVSLVFARERSSPVLSLRWLRGDGPGPAHTAAREQGRCRLARRQCRPRRLRPLGRKMQDR
jgi:hypothetical protein